MNHVSFDVFSQSFFDALFKIVEDLGPNSGSIGFILGMTLIITMRHMII